MLPLYHPAQSRQAKQMGRPRKVGKRLPTLKALIDNPTPLAHRRASGKAWSWRLYLQITSHTAVWYHTGLPAVPIRWVLLKDPKAQFQPQALCVQIHRLNLSKFCIGSATRNSKSLPLEVRAHLVEFNVNGHHEPSPTTPALLVLNRDSLLISSFFSIRLSCQSCLVSEDATDVC